ncbi:MAG TPA: hypothetical protein VND91_03445 [Candidatus Saccharimonadia bacterium]|nr:hypothetical protein [Candidatus Saccharimonadia bacterium]
MSSPESDPATLWSAASPLGELLATERRWFVQRRTSIAPGTRLWIGPAALDAANGDCVALVLGDDGLLSGGLHARADALPLSDGSVRLLVLQHALDRRVDPAVFGECVRVLATGGEIVVFGLNPISPWRPWLAWQTRSQRARPRPRMASRIAALFGQLGLGREDISWLGSSHPGAVGDDEASSSRRAMFRAAYALTMKKPHDTVIPLRPREIARALDLAPGLVPSATPRIRVGA